MNGDPESTSGWLDHFFASYYRHRPVNASFIGVHDYDHILPDFSENGAGDTVAEMQDLLSRPASGVPETSASNSQSGDRWEVLDRRLAKGYLKTQLWEYQSEHFHRGNPSLYTGEAVFSLLSMFLSDFSPLGERLESAAARMAEVPRFLSQARKNVRSAPLAWTERAIRECTGALAFLGGGVEALLKNASEEGVGAGRVARFGRAAQKAAQAFQSFQNYLESELRGNPTDTIACGEEALSLYLREGHFLTEPAQELLAYAEGELELAAARVEAHPEFSPEALMKLGDLHPSVDRYYDTYQEIWDAVRERAEDQGLLTWPEFPIRYVPRPLWSREAAPYLYFLFYRSPAAFNRPPVHDYLVTPIESDMPVERQAELLRNNNDSVIRLNHIIHHGGIGHHVQNWHAFRSPSRVGRMAAVDCASRIAMFCGGTMAEGWACYATDLMAEAGGLTSLETFAEMKGRTRMCARAIVDIRMHLGRLTLNEAADFYEQHAGMARGAAESEAVKNSMFPGAAVIYLFGTDAIHRLRAEMSADLGSAFNLRDFHDEFLSYGSIPVALIAQEMRQGR